MNSNNKKPEAPNSNTWFWVLLLSPLVAYLIEFELGNIDTAMVFAKIGSIIYIILFSLIVWLFLRDRW